MTLPQAIGLLGVMLAVSIIAVGVFVLASNNSISDSRLAMVLPFAGMIITGLIGSIAGYIFGEKNNNKE